MSSELQKYIVVEDYRPESGVELPLKKGQIVHLISKDGERKLWFGICDEKTGYFPKCAVKIYSAACQEPKAQSTEFQKLETSHHLLQDSRKTRTKSVGRPPSQHFLRAIRIKSDEDPQFAFQSEEEEESEDSKDPYQNYSNQRSTQGLNQNSIQGSNQNIQGQCEIDNDLTFQEEQLHRAAPLVSAAALTAVKLKRQEKLLVKSGEEMEQKSQPAWLEEIKRRKTSLYAKSTLEESKQGGNEQEGIKQEGSKLEESLEKKDRVEFEEKILTRRHYQKNEVNLKPSQEEVKPATPGWMRALKEIKKARVQSVDGGKVLAQVEEVAQRRNSSVGLSNEERTEVFDFREGKKRRPSRSFTQEINPRDLVGLDRDLKGFETEKSEDIRRVEARKEEARRLEVRRLEEARKLEARKMEEASKIEAKKLEEVRKIEQARKLEEAKKVEDARKLQESRKLKEAIKQEEVLLGEEEKKKKKEEAHKWDALKKEEAIKREEAMKKLHSMVNEDVKERGNEDFIKISRVDLLQVVTALDDLQLQMADQQQKLTKLEETIKNYLKD